MDPEKNNCMYISCITLINIGNYMGLLWCDLMANLHYRVISLHECNTNKSIDSELFTLSRESSSDSLFKYYVSDDEIFIDPKLE